MASIEVSFNVSTAVGTKVTKCPRTQLVRTSSVGSLCLDACCPGFQLEVSLCLKMSWPVWEDFHFVYENVPFFLCKYASFHMFRCLILFVIEMSHIVWMKMSHLKDLLLSKESIGMF